jgi:hypothetical protein
MGFGDVSSSFSYIPSKVPNKPLNTPRNVASQTDRTTLFVEYDVVHKDGGMPILSYNIYIDDGLSGSFTEPYINDASTLTWNS